MHARIPRALVLALLMGSTAAAQPEWSPTGGPAGGFAYELLNHEGTLFAANYEPFLSDGGVYRSTDGGSTWTFSNAGINGLVNSFAASGSTLLAGTFSYGIFRSTDGGTTWNPSNGGMANPFVLSLLAHQGTFYAGLEGPGIYKSTNGGVSWTPMNAGLPLTSNVISLFANGSTLFAGLGGNSGSVGVYRSTNGGASWTQSNTGLPFSPNPRSFAALDGALYVAVIGAGSGEYGIYKSTDGGLSWSPSNNGIPFIVGGNARSVFAHEGVLYAGTVDFFGTGESVYRSLNGGASWSPAGPGIPPRNVPGDTGHNFVASGSDVLVGLGSFASVYRTSDDGASWQPSNRGLSNHTLHALYARDGLLLGGTISGVHRSLDEGDTWTYTSTGLPQSKDVTDFLASGASIFAGTNGNGPYRSTDGGVTWTPANGGLSGFELYVQAMAASDGALYLATDGGIQKSTDNGASWTPASSGLPLGTDYTTAVAASGSTLFAGMAVGGIYKSTNGGASWTQTNNGLTVYDRNINTLLAHGAAVYAGTETGVFRSTDDGASWTKVTPPLPGPVFDLVAEGGTVYAALRSSSTGYGVWAGTDDGTTWAPINEGLTGPAQNVDALAVDDDYLYVGTRTRSVWRRPLEGTSAPVAVVAQPVGGPVVIGPGGGSFEFTVTLTNTTNQPQTFQAWSAVEGPVDRNPVVGPQAVTLPAGATVTRTLRQAVPANAPEGTYTYAVNVGTFPGVILASDSFLFVKEGSGAAARGTDASGGWTATGWEEAITASAVTDLPGGFALGEVYPNPFTTTAQLAIDVAATQAVRAEVFDGLGRRVALLHDGQLEAGRHAFVLDGSVLPAGVYVVRATSADGRSAVRRVSVLR